MVYGFMRDEMYAPCGSWIGRCLEGSSDTSKGRTKVLRVPVILQMISSVVD